MVSDLIDHGPHTLLMSSPDFIVMGASFNKQVVVAGQMSVGTDDAVGQRKVFIAAWLTVVISHDCT
jgi:hypothetical protein